MWRELRALLACPICSDVLQSPVTLVCGHTFCRSCIIDICNCSLCGCSYPLSSLKTNILLQELSIRLQNAIQENSFNTYKNVLKPMSNNAAQRHKWSKIYRRRGRRHLIESIKAFCLTALYESNNQNNLSQIVRKVLRSLNEIELPTSSFSTTCFNTECKYHTTNNTFETRISDVSQIQKIIERVLYKFEKSSPKDNFNSQIGASDVECVLCSRCFLDPVTTSCGHTFCRECLERVLDYGLACPLCVAPITAEDLAHGSTIALQQLLPVIAYNEYLQRKRSYRKNIENPGTKAPVFICTTAFPGVACPLFVYEPRYRLLTRRCLQSPQRQFAMAAAGSNSNERFAKFGTILEVKDAIKLQDGCSILTTIGVKRFRVLDSSEKDGYDVASIQYIQDSSVPTSQLPLLEYLHDQVYSKATCWINSLGAKIRNEIEQSFGVMPIPETNWHRLPDGPTWAWWLMAILPLGVQLQVGILGTTSLEKRLRAIDKTLEHVNARMNAITNNECIVCEGDELSDICSNQQPQTVSTAQPLHL